MISIIIPVYNSEKYLNTCLDSIKNQNCPFFEVICVNDGSIDSSEQIINEYLNDSRFIYLKKKHTNAGDARNLGLKHARGDYLFFMDSDDILVPNIIEELANIIVKKTPDILIFQYKLFNDKNKHLSKQNYGIHSKRKLCFTTKSIKRNILSITNIAVWNKLYSTTFIKSFHLNFKSYSSINDVYFSWSALMNAQKIFLHRKVGIYYRINSGNSISDNIIQTSNIIIDAFEEVNNYAIQNNLWTIYKKDLLKQELSQLSEFKTRLKKSKYQKLLTTFNIKMISFFKQYK